MIYSKDGDNEERVENANGVRTSQRVVKSLKIPQVKTELAKMSQKGQRRKMNRN